MQLVVLVGPKGAGKDTAADILKAQKKLAGSIPFALPLKRICSTVFEVPIQKFTMPTLKEKELAEPVKVTRMQLRKLKDEMLKYVDPYEEGKHHNLNRIPANQFVNCLYRTPRQILQQIGTNLIRTHVTPDWHCMAAFSSNNMNLSRINPTKIYAITDCRFVNEYAYIKANFPNAYFYYVERQQAEDILDQATHDSELETKKVKELLLADGGEILTNNGSVKDFEKLLKKVVIENRAPATPVDPNSSMTGRFKFAKRG